MSEKDEILKKFREWLENEETELKFKYKRILKTISDFQNTPEKVVEKNGKFYVPRDEINIPNMDLFSRIVSKIDHIKTKEARIIPFPKGVGDIVEYLNFKHEKTHYRIKDEYFDEVSKMLDEYFSRPEVQKKVKNVEKPENPSKNISQKKMENSHPLNTILYGPPGTGKTYKTIEKAVEILDSHFFENNENDRKELKDRYEELRKNGQIEFVTFHQSYGYEEFVEGIRAETENGNVNYKIKAGIFKEICEEAKKEKEKKFLLIIDEINRGNISKIFGELITLIESSKRAGESEEIFLKLPYSGDTFSVPNNLYILGTMNTSDRSIALLDTALRRRFRFVEMMPNAEILQKIDGVDLKKLLIAINDRIERLYDREHTIGHAFFFKCETLNDLRDVFEHEILPLLQEYFYDDWEKINRVLNRNGFLSVEKWTDDEANDEKEIFKIDESALGKSENYRKIYEKKSE